MFTWASRLVLYSFGSEPLNDEDQQQLARTMIGRRGAGVKSVSIDTEAELPYTTFDVVIESTSDDAARLAVAGEVIGAFAELGQDPEDLEYVSSSHVYTGTLTRDRRIDPSLTAASPRYLDEEKGRAVFLQARAAYGDLLFGLREE